jgi:peroxiredoxin Q/BCP
VKLRQGDEAPAFALRDADGKEWKLGDLKGGRVVIFFYPADDTPGCTTQACDFRDSMDAFRDAGYTILGISPQDENSKRRFSDRYGLNFPLLADVGAKVAAAYGVTHNGGFYKGIPLKVRRSTFVVDESGRIAKAMYGVKAKGHVAGLRESFGF